MWRHEWKLKANKDTLHIIKQHRQWEDIVAMLLDDI